MERVPPPAALGRVGRREWRRIEQLTRDARVLTARDLVVLEGYCQSYEQCHDAARAIARNLADELALAPVATATRRARDEQIVASGGGLARNRFGELVAHPSVRVLEASWRRVRDFALEFGLTPASRARVRAAEVSDPDAGAGIPRSMLGGKASA